MANTGLCILERVTTEMNFHSHHIGLVCIGWYVFSTWLVTEVRFSFTIWLRQYLSGFSTTKLKHFIFCIYTCIYTCLMWQICDTHFGCPNLWTLSYNKRFLAFWVPALLGFKTEMSFQPSSGKGEKLLLQRTPIRDIMSPNSDADTMWNPLARRWQRSSFTGSVTWIYISVKKP